MNPREIQYKFGQLEAERAACRTARERITVDLKIVELQEKCLHEKPYRHDFVSKDGKIVGHYCECCGKAWDTPI